MPGVARIGDGTNSEAKVGPKPGSTNVFVNSRSIATEGNSFLTPHQHGQSTITSTFVGTGNQKVLANGSPILKQGSQALCGHSITESSPNVETG